MEQLTDFGPWWYGPLFSTMIAGLTLFQGATGFVQTVLFGLIGFASAAVMAIHDYQRRAVRWPALHRSVGSAVGVVVAVLWILVVMAVGGTVLSTIGYRDFVPVYLAVGWLLTTALYLALRAVFQRVRAGRMPIT